MKKIDLEQSEENLRKVLESENIIQADIIEYMEKYYLDYALSVIVERALPDVSDGCKPVHRRIIWAMSELGVIPEKGYKKCARIVGEILGKYHVHGDSSVYGALVRMAQDFSMRYMLVDGHGNFGSVDGDSPASMRYTECKMKKLTQLMVEDIYKNTVDFVPNFDGEEREPVVLPSRFPNLLVNGSFGIAVGISSKIPPHNLKDSIMQAIYQIDNPNCTVEELVNILKAPDFPTGAIIMNPNDMVEMYSGSDKSIPIIMRGKYKIEGNDIIFYELPYGVNKEKLMTSIIKLKDGYYKEEKKGKQKVKVFVEPKISQLTEALDFSNERDGINIILKVNSESNINKVLKLLFINSELEYKFYPKFTAIDTQHKKLYINLSLKDMNNFYINHQKDVVKRRSEFELNKILTRQHILKGYVKALSDIDRVISLIKSSKNNSEAISKLVENIDLSNKQAEAIIEMKLRRLTNLEIEKIKTELQEINKQIIYLQNILDNEQVLLTVLKEELTAIAEKYSDDRRSEIRYEDELNDISDLELIDATDYKVLLTNETIKKHSVNTSNNRLKEGDEIIEDIKVKNNEILLCFTNLGNRFKLYINKLKEYNGNSFGDMTTSIMNLMPNEKVIKIISVNNKAEGHIIFTYSNGNISKIPVQEYLKSLTLMKNCYNSDSELISMKYIEKDCNVLFISSEGQGLIINTSTINEVSSRNSKGVCGIKLTEGYNVVTTNIGIVDKIHMILKTQKGKEKEYIFNDIAPTGQRNEERTLFNYIYSNRRSNKGNMIYNTRTNDDIVSSIIFE